jgi:signal transduction histidine kinase
MMLGQQQGREQHPNQPRNDNRVIRDPNPDNDPNRESRDFGPPFDGFGRPPIPPNMPLYSPDGTRVNERQPPAVDARLIIQTAKTRQESYMTFGDQRIYTRPIRFREMDLVFQAATSIRGLQDDLATITREMLLLSPIALLAATIAGMFLTRRMLSPVDAISRKAETIQAVNLSDRLPVNGTDEFGKLSQTINNMLSRLETQFEQQRRFVGDASHELRSPLTVIKGAAELGAIDDLATDRSRDYFRRINQAADRTTRLVENLLFLARSDNGVLVANRCETDVAELVQGAIDEVGASFTNHPAVYYQIEVQTLHIDGELMHRALCNLISNAYRHTPESGNVNITVTQTAFIVQDTGVGIPETHLPHVQERFYRVDASRTRKAGGTGLGLSIVQTIAAAHGGDVAIQSIEGAGTTVTISFSA